MKIKCKIFFSYNFPRWPVGVKSYHVVHVVLQVIAQSLKTRQQNGPKLKNTSNGNKYMLDYYYFIIMAHMKKKKEKKI